MIKTEFLDSEFYPVGINEASIIVCREVDENGNEIKKRIFKNLSDFSEKGLRLENGIEEQHWENAMAIQKIVDNLWTEYHRAQNINEKLRISKVMIEGYGNLDRLISNLELLRVRKRRYD